MKYLTVLPLTFFISLSVFSQDQESPQTDTTKNIVKNLTKQLERYEKLISQHDQKRKQDSLVKVELMKHIQLLGENEYMVQASSKNQIKEKEKRDLLRTVEQESKTHKLKATTTGSPVAPFRDTLFVIYTKLGSFKASDRAINMTKKIEDLVRSDYFYSDSLVVEEHDGTVDIMYQNLIIASVSDWDATWVGEASKMVLANSYLEAIRAFMASTRNRSSIKNVMAQIGLIFLILGGVLLIAYFIKKLISHFQKWIILNKDKYFTSIRIGNYDFLPPPRQLAVSLKVVGFLKWVFYVLIFYSALLIIFEVFPFTKGWAQTLLQGISNPAKDVLWLFWDYLPNLFIIIVIFLITRYLIKFLRFIVLEIELGKLSLTGFHRDWIMPTFRLIRFLIYVFMFVIVFPYLPGADSDVFKGVLLFLGLSIALGSMSSVSNIVAGLMITYMRPFRLEDMVKIGEISGRIVERKLLVTKIRTAKNEDITIPNSTILTHHTVNYSTNSQNLGLILHTSITIGYDVPRSKVHELLIEAAVATDGVNISREPFVLQTSLDSQHVSYQLNAYTDVPEKMTEIYSNLHANIQEKLQKAGITMISPQ